jgi:hypothetical protein
VNIRRFWQASNVVVVSGAFSGGYPGPPQPPAASSRFRCPARPGFGPIHVIRVPGGAVVATVTGSILRCAHIFTGPIDRRFTAKTRVFSEPHIQPHPGERPLGRVSKDGRESLMVRDARRRAPHHEGLLGMAADCGLIQSSRALARRPRRGCPCMPACLAIERGARNTRKRSHPDDRRVPQMFLARGAQFLVAGTPESGLPSRR